MKAGSIASVVVLTTATLLVAAGAATAQVKVTPMSMLPIAVANVELIIQGTIGHVETTTSGDQVLVVIGGGEVLKGEAREAISFRSPHPREKDASELSPGPPRFGLGEEWVVLMEADMAGELYCRGESYLVKEGRVLRKGYDELPVSADEFVERIRGLVSESTFAAAVKGAPLVVEGNVLTVKDNRMVTGAREVAVGFRVTKAHKGEFEGKTLDVVHVCGDQTPRDTPAFLPGEHAFICLEEDDDGTYRLVGGTQGKLSLGLRGRYHVGPYLLFIRPLGTGETRRPSRFLSTGFTEAEVLGFFR